MDYHLLIYKLLSEEISDIEKEKLDMWLDLHPENRELFEEVKLVWDNADLSETELDYDPEEELRAIHDRINRQSVNQSREQKPREQNSRPTRLKKRHIPAIAFVIILLITTNLLVWFLFPPSGNSAIAVTNREHFNEILLPDSSKVYLNENTSFSFEQNLNTRQAYLNGEAYFEVAKNSDRPFFVNLKNATIKVVGTSFNIRTSPENGTTEVIVTSGTVEVYNESDSIQLVQGEKASFNRQQKNILKSANTDPNFDSWRTGKLHFDNMELGKVLVVLENFYNIQFLVKNDKLLTCRFTGTFENDELEKVLKVLSYGLNFEYHYKKGEFLLTGEGCNQ